LQSNGPIHGRGQRKELTRNLAVGCRWLGQQGRGLGGKEAGRDRSAVADHSCFLAKRQDLPLGQHPSAARRLKVGSVARRFPACSIMAVTAAGSGFCWSAGQSLPIPTAALGRNGRCGAEAEELDLSGWTATLEMREASEHGHDRCQVGQANPGWVTKNTHTSLHSQLCAFGQPLPMPNRDRRRPKTTSLGLDDVQRIGYQRQRSVRADHFCPLNAC
jgi:hypothetical protein